MLGRAAKVGEALKALCKSRSSIWRTALIAAVQNIALRVTSLPMSLEPAFCRSEPASL